mmetsp:Transcript_11411/g.17555  ORF Transcript_11411/g.17555 Transcript_11411/m.17555 type:complete len:144 (+) Transcript_11411:141-572(+)
MIRWIVAIVVTVPLIGFAVVLTNFLLMHSMDNRLVVTIPEQKQTNIRAHTKSSSESKAIGLSLPPPCLEKQDSRDSNNTLVLSYEWDQHPFWNKGMKHFCDWIRQHQSRQGINKIISLKDNKNNCSSSIMAKKNNRRMDRPMS